MGALLDARWAPSFDGPTRTSRHGGKYHPYQPDTLVDRPLTIDAPLALRAFQVETRVRNLLNAPHARSLEGLARFLLRSEAIASSKIEGLRVSPQQIALAELAQADAGVVRGFTANAALVANNIAALGQATSLVVGAEPVTTADIDRLHRSLLPDDKHHGLRTVQNWIGGNDWNPIGADFVPPPPEQVEPLMDDLCGYVEGGAHAPLIQAALVHAQFETVHPYTDGNGRVGRSLIHTVLVRRGLTPSALLPVSLVFLTRSRAYVAGLTSYRHLGPPTSVEATRGVADWIATFLDAVDMATQQADRFSLAVAQLTEQWRERLAAYRGAQGTRRLPRAGSAQSRLLAMLAEVPVLTARSAQRVLDVSFPAARAALEELAEAKILRRRQVDRGTTGYLATEVFDLLTFAERELASTQWDTRLSSPVRTTPASPQH